MPLTFLNNILDIIFPVRCVSCNRNGAELCRECLIGCPTTEHESAKWIFPVYEYRHPPIRKTLWLLKYNNKKRVARIFAETLYESILQELSDLAVLENFTNPILIPIPLSHERYRERGYNQAELLCREIIKVSHLRDSVDVNTHFSHGLNMQLENNILIRSENKEHQAKIRDRRTRLKNIIGSFSINSAEENKIKNRNIILIDDITTTGATLSEAKKVLRKAGARKVIAFTVAH